MHRKRWGVSVFLVLVVLACFPTGVVGGKSDGGSCSSSSQCTSGVCRGGNCCGPKGRSTGCTVCDSDGDCSTCSSGYMYIKTEDDFSKALGDFSRLFSKEMNSQSRSRCVSIVGVAVPSYVGVVVLLAAIAGFVWCIRRRNAAKKARKGGTSAITSRASSETSVGDTPVGLTSADLQVHMMQAQVPVGISPGMQFQVKVGQQIVAVACPQGAGPGSMIPIQTPVQPVVVSLVEALPSREMTRQVSAAQVVPVDRPQSTNLDVEQIVIDVHVTNPALGRTSSTSSRTGIPNDVVEGNAEAEEKKCPQGHDLTLHTTEGDRGTCDGCSRSLDHGTKILNCIQCDFFLCNHCDPKIDASELSGGGRTRGSSESKSSTLQQQQQQQGHYSLPGRRFLSVIEGKTVTVITVPSRAAIPCLGPESYTPWLNDTPICTPTAEPVVEKQKTWSVGLVLLAIVFFPITLVVLPILGIIGLQGMLCPNEDLGSEGCCNEVAYWFECCHGCCCDDDGNCECECDGE